MKVLAIVISELARILFELFGYKGGVSERVYLIE
jgi:hypothetical protein